LQVAGFAGGLGEEQSALQGGHDGRREGHWPGTWTASATTLVWSTTNSPR